MPVIDSLGVLLQSAELRASIYRRTALRPARTGFFHAQPPADAIEATRAFYRTLQG